MQNNFDNLEQNKIILYESEDGVIYVDVYFYDETFWLTQKSIAELFKCSSDNVSLHLKNIYETNELAQIQLPRISRWFAKRATLNK